MLPRLKRIWADPVWSKVISAAIIGAAVYAATVYWPNAVTDLAAGLWGTLKSAWNYTTASSSVPNWLLGILVLMAGGLLLIVGLVIKPALFEKDASDPRRDYVSDEFLGMKWRWRYTTYGEPCDFTPHCPACDYQIVPERISAFAAVEILDYRCDNCGRNCGRMEELLYVTIDRVLRLVQRKLRTGEWQRQQA